MIKYKRRWFRRRIRLTPLQLLVLAGLLAALHVRTPAPSVSDSSLASSPGARHVTIIQPQRTRSGGISCPAPYIIDGDTFDCDGRRIRLSGIDAPEMPDHCRPGRACTPGDPFASKAYLESLTRTTVVCHRTDTDSYGRTVARCAANGKDLSCAMVKAGHAVKRYAPLNCR